MELAETTHMVGAGLVASAQEQAVVAELMEPSERLVGDPPLCEPRADPGQMLLLVSPGEPDDESDDE
jgi:hypothetical protein